MGLSAFVHSLTDSGRVVVDPFEPVIVADEQASVAELLCAWDTLVRQEFPGPAPPLAIGAASWAAEQFYRVCQFAVYRDLDAQIIAATLATPCPETLSAASVYSVDLVFRFLPDLQRLVKARAAADPLVDSLNRCAEQWPLSSVGIRDIEQFDAAVLDVVREHPGLWRLYIDRVIERRDLSRLADHRVQLAVAGALGLHEELSPVLAAAMKKRGEIESV
jgi:hypothetical protein